jgi:hypothetical protein
VTFRHRRMLPIGVMSHKSGPHYQRRIRSL